MVAAGALDAVVGVVWFGALDVVVSLNSFVLILSLLDLYSGWFPIRGLVFRARGLGWLLEVGIGMVGWVGRVGDFASGSGMPT